MKKKILTWILTSAVLVSVLAGCGAKAELVTSESVEETVEETAEEPEEEPEYEPEEEPECTHEWADATFTAPKTCVLCGETEGERRQSYFEEHGIEVPDAPVACTVDVLNCVEDNEKEYQMATDAVWEQVDCNSEPADEDGYQLIYLKVNAISQNHYYAEQDIYYNNTNNMLLIYDWYTGSRILGSEDDTFKNFTTLDLGEISYDVFYTKETQWKYGDFTYADNGDATKPVKFYANFIFKVPESYDGLVFAVVPVREYEWFLDGTDHWKYAPLDEADENYVEGIRYFRINRNEDSPIISGENTASVEISDQNFYYVDRV